MMRPVRNVGRALGVTVGLGATVVATSCVSGEFSERREDEMSMSGGGGKGGGGAGGAGGAGTPAGTAGQLSGTGGQSGSAGSVASSGASSVSGGAGTSGSSGSAGATSGGSGGMLSAGGASGSSGAGGAASGMSAGGASAGMAGTGPTCSDDPPPNGTCQDAVNFGWCGEDWMNGACARTCNLCTGGGGSGNGGSSSGGSGNGGSSNGGSSGASSGSGGGPGVSPPPNITNGQNAWASRYWDCCKPACGWTANAGGNPMKACSKENQPLSDPDARNACESGGSAFMCWSGAPWQVGENLSYGFAAASGGNYTCGRCFHIQFTGSSHNGGMNPGAQALNGKHMIVQVINNGGVAADQFDLLIPGGGVGALNACSNQWGSSDLGAQYGGFLAGCNGDLGCVQNKCDTIFGNKPELLAGCDWFLGWFQAADNPNFVYERIACPAEITQRSGLSDR